MLLKKIQQQFEAIYQLPQDLSIEDFLINQETLEKLKEQQYNLPNIRNHKGLMLLFPEENELRMAVYLHDHVISNLLKYNPFWGLNEKNIRAFCIMAEEVSHFLYTTWKARHSIQITRLELELQAEVDKFIICTLYCLNQETQVNRLSLKELLFETFSLEKDLSLESQNRYSTASKLALHYCHFLENHFIKKTLLSQMMEEIRRFYRLGQTDKISRINRTIFFQQS